MGCDALARGSNRRAACLVLLALSACGADDEDDSSGAGTQESTCATACEGSTSSASTDDGSTTTAASETTLPPGESTTAPAESSSTGTEACPMDTCAACFQCSYHDGCAAEQAQCSVDAACSIALICVRDCIEQSRDPATCVAACDCPSEGALPALLTCATAICVANDSCPALSC